MEKISPEKIATSGLERGGQSTVPVSSDPLQPDPIYAQRLGEIGKLVGGGSEKPGNIAVLGIICGVLLILFGAAGLIFADLSGGAIEGLKLVIGGGFSLVTGAMGYVFGSSNARSHD